MRLVCRTEHRSYQSKIDGQLGDGPARKSDHQEAATTARCHAAHTLVKDVSPNNFIDNVSHLPIRQCIDSISQIFLGIINCFDTKLIFCDCVGNKIDNLDHTEGGGTRGIYLCSSNKEINIISYLPVLHRLMLQQLPEPQ